MSEDLALPSRPRRRHRADGVIDVDIRDPVGAGQQRCARQLREQTGGDRVELADVPRT